MGIPLLGKSHAGDLERSLGFEKVGRIYRLGSALSFTVRAFDPLERSAFIYALAYADGDLAYIGQTRREPPPHRDPKSALYYRLLEHIGRGGWRGNKAVQIADYVRGRHPGARRARSSRPRAGDDRRQAPRARLAPDRGGRAELLDVDQGSDRRGPRPPPGRRAPRRGARKGPPGGRLATL